MGQREKKYTDNETLPTDPSMPQLQATWNPELGIDKGKNMEQTSTLKVCYVLKRYPHLSETFIVNEMTELRRQGVDITIAEQKDSKLLARAMENILDPGALRNKLSRAALTNVRAEFDLHENARY